MKWYRGSTFKPLNFTNEDHTWSRYDLYESLFVYQGRAIFSSVTYTKYGRKPGNEFLMEFLFGTFTDTFKATHYMSSTKYSRAMQRAFNSYKLGKYRDVINELDESVLNQLSNCSLDRWTETKISPTGSITVQDNGLLRIVGLPNTFVPQKSMNLPDWLKLAQAVCLRPRIFQEIETPIKLCVLNTKKMKKASLPEEAFSDGISTFEPQNDNDSDFDGRLCNDSNKKCIENMKFDKKSVDRQEFIVWKDYFVMPLETMCILPSIRM